MMITEHDAIPGTEYYETEQYLTQEQDEEEMAQWFEFNAYQDFTDETAIYPEDNAQEYVMYGLLSEIGEMAGKMKKELRDGTIFYTDDYIKELGDVLWYVAQLASIEGICLSDVARINVEKLKSRKERNTISGEGDNR